MNHSNTTQLLGLLAGLVEGLDRVDYYFVPETFLRKESGETVVGIKAGGNSREMVLPRDTAYRLGFDFNVTIDGPCLLPQAKSRRAKTKKFEPMDGEKVIVLMISAKGKNEFVPAMWVWKREALELMQKVHTHGVVRVADDEYVYWIGLEEKLLNRFDDGQYVEFLKPGADAWSKGQPAARTQASAPEPEVSEVKPAETRSPGFMTLARNGLGELTSLLGTPVSLATA